MKNRPNCPDICKSEHTFESRRLVYLRSSTGCIVNPKPLNPKPWVAQGKVSHNGGHGLMEPVG